MPGEGTKRQEERGPQKPSERDEKEKKRIQETDVDPGGDTTSNSGQTEVFGGNRDSSTEANRGQEDIRDKKGRSRFNDAHPDSTVTGLPSGAPTRTRDDEDEERE